MKASAFSGSCFTLAALIALSCIVGISPLPADDYKLEDWTLGEIVAGDEMDLSELDGRVVAIEFWGTR